LRSGSWISSLRRCWGPAAPIIAALRIATASGRHEARIPCPTATGGAFLDPVGDRWTLLQEMLQKIKIAKLTTEAATLRCFMVGSRGIVCAESQDSAASDNFSVLDNYELPPERIIARFGNDGERWRNMRKCLSELSLRGRRVLFLSKPALSPRQCGKHCHNSLIVRAYQLVMRIMKWRQPLLPVESSRVRCSGDHICLNRCWWDSLTLKRSSRCFRVTDRRPRKSRETAAMAARRIIAPETAAICRTR
jgi:hypothetical protein